MKRENENHQAVLGIGNALVDVINVLNSDEVLAEFGLLRGSMTLVDMELSRKIYDATFFNKREVTTGGSAANTIHALARLGGQCGYLGKIGNDQLGSVFSGEFERLRINNHLIKSEKGTGRVLSLVSSDSERTMATYLGAAADLKPDELSREIFRQYAILYLEGYLVQNQALIEKAIDIARKERMTVAIDLSSFNIVEMNLAFLKRLIAEKVDIVFANEEEAFAFTGKAPEEAAAEIASVCKIAVVKTGKSGSIIQEGKERIRLGAIQAKALDTTGAGDSYAAGFFYGLTRGYSLEKSGKIAAHLSGKVVEVMGAKLPEHLWPGVFREISEMN